MPIITRHANPEIVSLFSKNFDVFVLSKEILERVEIPAKNGVYMCEIKNCEIKTTNNEKEYLFLKFKVLEGDEKGKTIKGTVFMNSPSGIDDVIQKLRSISPEKDICTHEQVINYKLSNEDKSMKYLVAFQKREDELSDFEYETIEILGRN